MDSEPPAPIVVDSVTKLPPESPGRVLVGGSHGGLYAAYLSVKAGVRGAIHNDAGVGREDAGIAGLAYADRHGMAMAVVSADSARIGDGPDMMARGIISHANDTAIAGGVIAGLRCAEAASRLATCPWPHAMPQALDETRSIESDFGSRWRVVCMDSISLLQPGDRGAIIASGSHGGVPAGTTAAGSGAGLVLFNDAGFGIDRAGIAGLAILDQAGIAAATVAAVSARIGDGRSTLYDGTISAANRTAERIGVRIGETALDLLRRLTDSPRP